MIERFRENNLTHIVRIWPEKILIKRFTFVFTYFNRYILNIHIGKQYSVITNIKFQQFQLDFVELIFVRATRRVSFLLRNKILDYVAR